GARRCRVGQQVERPAAGERQRSGKHPANGQQGGPRPEMVRRRAPRDRRGAPAPKKPTAFRPNTTGGLVTASKKPPKAEPTMPEKFIWSEPSVAAEGSSSSGTASGISGVQ